MVQSRGQSVIFDRQLAVHVKELMQSSRYGWYENERMIEFRLWKVEFRKRERI
jgi:hypothetical protein